MKGLFIIAIILLLSINFVAATWINSTFGNRINITVANNRNDLALLNWIYRKMFLTILI